MSCFLSLNPSRWTDREPLTVIISLLLISLCYNGRCGFTVCLMRCNSGYISNQSVFATISSDAFLFFIFVVARHCDATHLICITCRQDTGRHRAPLIGDKSAAAAAAAAAVKIRPHCPQDDAPLGNAVAYL